MIARQDLKSSECIIPDEEFQSPALDPITPPPRTSQEEGRAREAARMKSDFSPASKSLFARTQRRSFSTPGITRSAANA